jgi:hypothetical protein
MPLTNQNMSELTKEYFEEYLGNQINGLEGKLVTKKEFKSGVEELARMVAHGFSDVERRLDVTTRMEHMEADLSKIKGALNMT